MKIFKDWYWIDSWAVVLILAALGLMGLGVYAMFQDHSIRFYYISDHGSGTSRNGDCISGYRNWWVNDTGVFCSDDIQKTLSVLKEMNDGLVSAAAGRHP